jgi:hypothetical protein
VPEQRCLLLHDGSVKTAMLCCVRPWSSCTCVWYTPSDTSACVRADMLDADEEVRRTRGVPPQTLRQGTGMPLTYTCSSTRMLSMYKANSVCRKADTLSVNLRAVGPAGLHNSALSCT